MNRSDKHKEKINLFVSFMFLCACTMTIKRRIFLILISYIIYLNCFSQFDKDTGINFYFETNSSKLDSNQYRQLHELLQSVHIKSIIGYADSTGAKDYNFSLSKKRAFAVYIALNNGRNQFNKSIILYNGESTEEPELWKNRRVQIIAGQIPVREFGTDTVVNNPGIVRTFNLENLYFIPDQAIITQESLSYIQELAEILKKYKTETFEIIGHINYQSRFDSSHLTDIFQLSERRAKAVYDYLIEFGISATRMTFKGAGNSRPVYPSPVNDEQRRKNMRVEIVIKK